MVYNTLVFLGTGHTQGIVSANQWTHETYGKKRRRRKKNFLSATWARLRETCVFSFSINSMAFKKNHLFVYVDESVFTVCAFSIEHQQYSASHYFSTRRVASCVHRQHYFMYSMLRQTKTGFRLDRFAHESKNSSIATFGCECLKPESIMYVCGMACVVCCINCISFP